MWASWQAGREPAGQELGRDGDIQASWKVSEQAIR
jgi:hypothetical protein